jgi:hypothetical protein
VDFSSEYQDPESGLAVLRWRHALDQYRALYGIPDPEPEDLDHALASDNWHYNWRYGGYIRYES